MVGRLFASGAQIYIAAIPLSMILFGPDRARSPRYSEFMILSIAALTVAGKLYALVGGISGVIWTDVIQTVVLVVAVFAAIWVLWLKIDLPLAGILNHLRHGVSSVYIGPPELEPSKLTVLKVGLDPSQPKLGFDASEQFTVLTACTGFALLNVAAYGTDHDMVQRMLTCRSAVK